MIKLKSLVMSEIGGDRVKVVLFGSRARGDNSPYSDVDIGLIPGRDFDSRKIAFLKDKIADSNIPYKVEVVNFAEVGASFKEEAMKGAVVWKD